MQRLLIANRGEIARRITQTARDLGFETVAVFTSEDEELATGYGADETVALTGTGSAGYLDVHALVDLAQSHACDALHPGYGFLSERPELAEACLEAGITFVGPSPETLRLFGDKARARALAEQEGVPIVPGLPAPASVDAVEGFLRAQPPGRAILLKAVGGGGGRGLRRVDKNDDVSALFTRCQSEAERFFGRGELFAEQLIEAARHVEIQIAADERGDVVHLWERDCSFQRRNQKIVEIAPAPALSQSLRDRLIHAAIQLASASALRGLGTFEFLVEPDDTFYFIEANPRLQVEHTVTEAITGVDLVAAQLALADGRPLVELGMATPPPVRGQAMQLRVLAEALDAHGQILPSPETITAWQPPGGPGIRVDTALRTGLSAHPAFDALIAKLIVHAPTEDPDRLRRQALRALEDFWIEGPRTNLDFLAALLERPEWTKGRITTGFIERKAAVLVDTAAQRRTRVRTASAAHEPRAGTGIEAGPAQANVADGLAPPGCQPLSAPLIGTLLELHIAVGDRIRAGQPVAVLESMKMEHVIEAPAAGSIERIDAVPGDVLAEGARIAWLRPGEDAAVDERVTQAIDLDAIRPDLAEVHARHALLEDESRPNAVERRRSRGQRTARENLAAICDPDTFREYGALAVAAMRRARPIEELRARTPGDAIITGTGLVNGDLFERDAARCALLVVDATVLAGTQGYFHHKKIDRILEVAAHAGMPVIFFPEGGGGRPNDTDASDVFVAGLNVTSFRAFAALSGKVPRIAVVSGFCFAGSAAFAGCADVIIATRNTSLGMGGPAMIEGGGLGVHAPQDVGPTSVQVPNGVIDLLVEDEEEAAVEARRYLAYFQGRTGDWRAPDVRTLRHVIPENRRRVYDVRELIRGLCDLDSIMELRREYAPGMITALVRVEGQPMGLVANDPVHLGGAIDDEGAEKAARFLQLCDAFALPVLSLCDTPGFMVGPEIEARGQVRKVSRLFVVGAQLRVPLFCVITRKAYGLGAQAMAGGSFLAPFDCVAWPTGEIGGMGLEGAVNLGFRKQLDACASEEERAALFEKLVGVLYEKGKALHAASALEFDAVIDPAETRTRIVRGLEAFGPIASGERGFVDTW